MATSIARARRVRVSARKMRLVADLIRGKKVGDARHILVYTTTKSAPIIRKVLESAVANAENVAAENRERIDTDEMIVRTIRVDEAETTGRYRPAPRGRAVPIRKRSSHVELILSDD